MDGFGVMHVQFGPLFSKHIYANLLMIAGTLHGDARCYGSGWESTSQLMIWVLQELMPSIDDEDIERQVKARMQRHRLKVQKRLSKMKA